MSVFTKSLAIACLGLLSFVPGASAQRHGRVIFGGGFGGPGFYGGGFYGPYSYYGPYYGPYYGWGYGGGYGYGSYGRSSDMGKVKIKTDLKDASVYVDGGYAGQTNKLKDFPLKTGSHDIELRDHNGNVFHHERIQVLAGRTIEIRPDFQGQQKRDSKH
jgi:PEGA domain-containing protein